MLLNRLPLCKDSNTMSQASPRKILCHKEIQAYLSYSSTDFSCLISCYLNHNLPLTENSPLAFLNSSGVLKAVRNIGLEVFENGEHGPVIIKG